MFDYYKETKRFFSLTPQVFQSTMYVYILVHRFDEERWEATTQTTGGQEQYLKAPGVVMFSHIRSI